MTDQLLIANCGSLLQHTISLTIEVSKFRPTTTEDKAIIQSLSSELQVFEKCLVQLRDPRNASSIPKKCLEALLTPIAICEDHVRELVKVFTSLSSRNLFRKLAWTSSTRDRVRRGAVSIEIQRKAVLSELADGLQRSGKGPDDDATTVRGGVAGLTNLMQQLSATDPSQNLAMERFLAESVTLGDSVIDPDEKSARLSQDTTRYSTYTATEHNPITRSPTKQPRSPNATSSSGIFARLRDSGAGPVPPPARLFQAVEKGDKNDLLDCLQNGADVNSTNERGEPVLYVAAGNDEMSCVRVLLAAGADTEIKDPRGRVALHQAATYGREAIIIELLAVGARVDSRTNAQDTPLHVAENHLSLQATRTLLDAGADVNARNDEGNTPLHNSTTYLGHDDHARLLIAAGAHVNAVNKRHQTPMSRAIEKGSIKAMSYLAEHGGIVGLAEHKSPQAIEASSKFLLDYFGRYSMDHRQELVKIYRADCKERYGLEVGVPEEYRQPGMVWTDCPEAIRIKHNEEFLATIRKEMLNIVNQGEKVSKQKGVGMHQFKSS